MVQAPYAGQAGLRTVNQVGQRVTHLTHKESKV